MGEREVPDDEALFDELEKLAVFGDDARVLLYRVADDYRQLESPG